MADITFCGESFAVPDRIGVMPLMRFAKVAKTGVDSDDLEGLAAIYDMLQQCIAPQDWARFEKTADDNRCDGDELMAVVKDVFEVLSERPTSRPSDSSAGSPFTAPSSTDDSSSRVIGRLENQGRPDLALMVMQARESREQERAEESRAS